MKKFKYFIYFIILALLGFCASSCSKKIGCKATENISSMPQADKKGRLKRSITKSGLFKKN